MPGYHLTALDSPHWTFLLRLTRFGGMPGYRLTPFDCPLFAFLLCFARFGSMPGYEYIDSIGLPILNVSIVFYTLRSQVRVQLDFIGLPSLSFPFAFYMLWRHVRVQIDSIGLFYRLWRSTALGRHIACFYIVRFTRFIGMPGYRLSPLDSAH